MRMRFDEEAAGTGNEFTSDVRALQQYVLISVLEEARSVDICLSNHKEMLVFAG